MRRGRPTKNAGEHSGVKPSPSPLRAVDSDPFAALDSNGAGALPGDELSSRFPTLDQFSLLHNSSNTFSFDAGNSKGAAEPRDLSQRVTEALADNAFAASTQTEPSNSRSSEAGPVKKSSMVSTGTMTMPEPQARESQSVSPAQRPIYRFPPSDQRAASQPRVTPNLSREASYTGTESLALKSRSQTSLTTKTSPLLRAEQSPGWVDPKLMAQTKIWPRPERNHGPSVVRLKGQPNSSMFALARVGRHRISDRVSPR